MELNIRGRKKTSNQWARTTRLWKKLNPADFDGYYYCRVGGGALTDKASGWGLPFNLCHDIARARDVSKKHSLDNLYPGCPKHNREQGSLSLEEYLETNPDLHCGI